MMARKSVSKPATDDEKPTRTELNAGEQRFVEEYLIDLNQAAAARRAGYSVVSAKERAYKIMKRPQVRRAIDAALAERSARTRITADRVLQQLWETLQADPNDLIQYRRGCCRHCYGTEHRYQRTAGEMERARENHRLATEKARADGKPLPPAFDEQGGIGYDPRKEPVTECPECFGEGVGQAFVQDTRDLPPGARHLYGGVKETKDGLQVVMQSKDKSMELAMRHLGLLNDKLTLERPRVTRKDFTGRRTKPDAE